MHATNLSPSSKGHVVNAIHVDTFSTTKGTSWLVRGGSAGWRGMDQLAGEGWISWLVRDGSAGW